MQVLREDLAYPTPHALHEGRLKCAFSRTQRDPNASIPRKQEVRDAVPIHIPDLRREFIYKRVRNVF
jgi:hypothetical protein